MLGRGQERGDTIVEVLLAVSIFSLIVVGALALVNNAATTAQRSLEATLVRQQMDAQAEGLRLMHNAYSGVHKKGQSYATNDNSMAAKWWRLTGSNNVNSQSATEFGNCTPRQSSFFVNNNNMTIVSIDSGNYGNPETIAKVEGSSSRGVWIEAVRSADTTGQAGYIDFHIRACWDSAGVGGKMTLGSIVRLYEVR